MGQHVKPFDGQVILELKFTGRFPGWFRELVEALGLYRTSAAKYAAGIELLGEDRMRPMAKRVADTTEASAGPPQTLGVRPSEAVEAAA
jgi:hypothetical protein